MVEWAPASPQGIQGLGTACANQVMLRPSQIAQPQTLHHPSALWPCRPTPYLTGPVTTIMY